ncbi:MAG: VIT domain-containing protein [Candidatus Kapaibacterium sp.]
MDKRIIVVLLCTFLSVCASMQAQYGNILQVLDPKQTWRSDRGSIDSAVLTVKPAGAYFEYGLYLNLSARGTSFTKVTDTLEIAFQFSLDQNAMMIDSWLWVEDTIVKAMLIDRGQAQQIYEGIVARRRDPSILYKNSATSYEFRIFPLAGNSSRRVKISWLQPATWSATNVTSWLPSSLLSLSKSILPSYRIIALEDPTWEAPTIPAYNGTPALTFTDVNDPTYGKGKEVTVKNTYYASNLSLQYSSPLKNGFYVQCYEDQPNEGYYQLVMLTKQAVDLTAAKKTLFIVDFDASRTSLSRADVLAELKAALSSNFTAKDSFNILLSNSSDHFVSEQWISASAENINSTFSTLKEEQLSLFSYLQLSLPSGLKYVSTKGRGANIILMSSSDGIGNYKVANPLIEEIAQISNFSAQINCIDYSTDRRQYYQGSMYYSGNFYLYDYLTKWSGGYFVDAAGKTLSTSITSIINNAEGKIQSLELYTTLDSGFCYARYDQVLSQAQKDAGMVIQVGRYFGKLPVVVRATGFYQDKPFSKETRFTTIAEKDSTRMLRRIWNGNYIYKLETGVVTNEVIKEIIDVSRRNRVLSRYTAFLALEPWRMPKDDYYFYQPEKKETGGGGSPSAVDEPIVVNSGTIQIKAFPNPFTSSIHMEFSELAAGMEITGVEIYNTLGVLVKTFDSSMLLSSKTLDWNGDDINGADVSSGMYSIVVKTTKGSVRFNVVLTR